MELVYPNEKRLFTIALVIASIIWLVLIAGTVGIALVYIGFFLLIALFVQSAFISHVKGSGVLVTPEQFPDLHRQIEACCRRVGVDPVPDTYLLRTDFFNALATRFLRRHYIVLFTDVIDALEDRPEAVNFYIGHELGHIHRNHIWWTMILSPALILPILGSAYRRAEEYTCDRYGNACCEDTADVSAALAAIVAGNTRWKTMSVPAYLKQVESTGGFWMSLNELIGDYPWLSKRMAWLMALREGRTPSFPRRHPVAWLLSVFVPGIPGGAASLFVTIAIIGILAAIALPAYQDYVKAAQAQTAAANSTNTDQLAYAQYLTPENLALVNDEMNQIRAQVDEYRGANQQFPAALTDLGWENDVIYSEHGGMPVQIYENGIIAAGFGQTESGEVYFVNEPLQSDDGTFNWVCWGQNIAQERLPPACR